MTKDIFEKIRAKLTVYFLYIPVYFFYTAKPNVLNPIFFLRKFHQKKAFREIKELDGGALYDLLHEVIKKSNSTGCEYSDYVRIWKDLNDIKPKTILECGSGISSVVFAYYISKLKDPFSVAFISMEENDGYHNQIKNIFPKKIREFVNFCVSERAESFYNGKLGCHYKEIPDLKYDYIFIDAPTVREVLRDKSYPKAFNSDVINIILRHPEHSISGILDQRIDTLRALRKLIPGGNISYRAAEKLSLLRDIRSDQLLENIEVRPRLRKLS